MANPDRVAHVTAAQELHAERLLKLPNVVGTGTGFRQLRGRIGTEVCVQVFVQQKLDAAELPDWAIVPREVHLGDERVRLLARERLRAVHPDHDGGVPADDRGDLPRLRPRHPRRPEADARP